MRTQPFENEAEFAHAHGITVGTRLKGVGKYATVEIVVTGVGESQILARQVVHNDEPIRGFEQSWTLSMKDWEIVEENGITP